MRKLLLLLFVVSSFAFAGQNLEGNYFGHVKYEGKRRQVGLLLNKITEEEDSYYAVVMEYLSPFREDNFIADFFRAGKKKLFSKKQNGYLEELLQWVRIYKMVKDEGANTYSFQKLQVKDGKVIALENSDSSVLTIKKTNKKGIKKAFMVTKIDGKLMSLKFNSRRRFPLKSTWEKKYIPGPYNPGYKQADVQVLDLVRNFDEETRTATANFTVDKLKGKELNIHGTQTIKEAYKGMFIFTQKTAGTEKVQDKIGVFIDVYNFQPIMNTVELILIDPADDKNSQMYFEEFGNEDENE